MTIPKINKEDIQKALEYIDKNGVPQKNRSTKYILVAEDGKEYPPKYVVAVADHLANGLPISIDAFNSIDVNNWLKHRGFTIETKQERFELTITAEGMESTDERFTIDNLHLGDNYTPLDAYMKRANGEIIKRDYQKSEQRISNQTLPRIAFQVFEKQIAALSVEEKENFPVVKYDPESEVIRGIYTSFEEFLKHFNSDRQFSKYSYDNGRQFVIYCWNVFSTLYFLQECLKRFGKPGDRFILMYREKEKKESEAAEEEAAVREELDPENKSYLNPYSSMLVESKNLILRGAPGTGKTYLAKEIAADIISDGYFDDYTLLTEEQKKQVAFVQFHPSYNYSDFVEGLRPEINEDGTMGFELQDGIFKAFVARARKNYEDSQKSEEAVKNEASVQEAMKAFFDSVEFGVDTFQTINGNGFTITDVDDRHIYVYISENSSVNRLTLNLDILKKMLESGQEFEKIKDITAFFGKTFATQGYSYIFPLYKAIRAQKDTAAKAQTKPEELKKYIFIIDEINRGEISKIFGELFFAIDPGYRGKAGEIATQYANLHADPDEKFYIPENVYIIGTMNDIDRSVDSFDFAMRRRFRFVELKADENLAMLAKLEDEELEAEAIRRMTALNHEIAGVEDLNENYQIGASYFLKLKTIDFDKLWTDYLQPLLQDYIQGMYDEESIMNRFAKAYGYEDAIRGDEDETDKDQG